LYYLKTVKGSVREKRKAEFQSKLDSIANNLLLFAAPEKEIVENASLKGVFSNFFFLSQAQIFLFLYLCNLTMYKYDISKLNYFI